MTVNIAITRYHPYSTQRFPGVVIPDDCNIAQQFGITRATAITQEFGRTHITYERVSA